MAADKGSERGADQAAREGVVAVEIDVVTGPFLDRSIRALVATLHGASAAAELAALLEQPDDEKTGTQARSPTRAGAGG